MRVGQRWAFRSAADLGTRLQIETESVRKLSRAAVGDSDDPQFILYFVSIDGPAMPSGGDGEESQEHHREI